MIKKILLLISLTLVAGCSTKSEVKDVDKIVNEEKLEEKKLEEVKEQEKYQKTMMAFDTVVDIVIYSDDKSEADKILTEAEELCYYYDDILNKSKENSLVSKINKNKVYELNGTKEDEILLKIINKSIEYSEITNGYFDITISPLVELWGIGDGNNHVPNEKDIKEVIELIDYKNIEITEEAITLKDNTTIDLGAIGKGFIADELKDFLIDNGVNSGLLNFGGNVLTIGAKPNEAKYIIGVREPFENAQDILGTVQVEDKSIVTSGIYERYFVENDVLYHHILDPTTGYPSENNLLSVTIISSKSIDSDAFSTSAFLLGVEKGLELINSVEDTEAMFITKDNEYFYSDNFIEEYKFQTME